MDDRPGPHNGLMRIGTWNMAGRTGPAHVALLQAQRCDVWLLTAVPERLLVADYVLHLGSTTMGSAARGGRQRWAGLLSSRTTLPLPDPHPASAAASIAGRTFVSSVLPWNGCGEHWPWAGQGPAAKTAEAVRVLVTALSAPSPGGALVWGGDWNDATAGPDGAGSRVGRESINRALEGLGLALPTRGLPQRMTAGQITSHTSSHIAVPVGDTVLSAHRISGVVDGVALSDHDAYVIETG